MSLTKSLLRDKIYEDLAQEDVVLQNGDIICPPEDYFTDEFEVGINDKLFSINPLDKRDDKDYYDILERRGNIKNPMHRIEVDSDIINDFVDTGEVTLPELDEERNLLEMQTQAVENHRIATVISDRIIEHIVDNLWTEDAANNINKVRVYLQILIEKFQDLIQDNKSMAELLIKQDNSFKQLITIVKAMGAQCSGVVPSISAQTAQLNVLEGAHRNYSIDGNCDLIKKNIDNYRLKLRELDSSLDDITYENSRGVI